MRHIVSDGVPPRRNTAVASQEITVPRFKFHKRAFLDRLPLKRGVQPLRTSLKNLQAGHSEQERLIRGHQVLAVAALEADYRIGILNKLNTPSRILRRSVPTLSNRLLVFVGEQILLVMAPEADDLGVAEEIHVGIELSGGDAIL